MKIYCRGNNVNLTFLTVLHWIQNRKHFLKKKTFHVAVFLINKFVGCTIQNNLRIWAIHFDLKSFCYDLGVFDVKLLTLAGSFKVLKILYDALNRYRFVMWTKIVKCDFTLFQADFIFIICTNYIIMLLMNHHSFSKSKPNLFILNIYYFIYK